MKIAHIVGNRPQFIKVAAVSRAIKEHKSAIQEILIHTGQHYDNYMSQIFFDELQIKKPKYNLKVVSYKDGEMIGTMLIKIELILIKEKPDYVLVYGDTNSSLAGGLAANKLNIPLAHIEAGVRSYNQNMPEEINRVILDHISNFLFCPTYNAVINLKEEKITSEIFRSGDVMYDSFLYYKKKINESKILSKFQIKRNSYFLATIHRQENMKHLETILKIFEELTTKKSPFIIPLHPRTNKFIDEKWMHNPVIKFFPPVGYFDMLALESNARLILTDSGGIQREAYFIGAPCVILRKETEWPETNQNYLNSVSDIKEIVFRTIAWRKYEKINPSLFGNGEASNFIVNKLCKKS